MNISNKIELIKTEKLYPYHNNPKKHNPDQINKIASSIRNYGFVQPLVIDNENEVIIGHGRLKAAQKLELEEVPVIVKDDLTVAQIKALRIADNKVAESDWDVELLRIELDDLEDEFTGFDIEEINQITDINAAEVKEDNFNIEENLSKNIITKKNDLIQLGRHKLLCGDSTKKEDINKLMDGEEADMVFTDPPYNVNYGDKANMLNDYQKGHRNTDAIENDNMENNDFFDFLFKFYKNAYANTKEGGAIYVCHADTEGINFRQSLVDAGWMMKQCLIWVKSNLVLGRQDYQWRHEPILYGWKPGAAHVWNNDRKQTTVIEPELGVKISEKENSYQITADTAFGSVVLEVPDYKIINNDDDSIQTTWYFAKPSINEEHPTMKPVKLCARAIRNSSLKNEIVFDPFAGSGSTLIAGEELKRKCFMVECAPKYCDVIIRRYINYKQKKMRI